MINIELLKKSIELHKKLIKMGIKSHGYNLASPFKKRYKKGKQP